MKAPTPGPRPPRPASARAKHIPLRSCVACRQVRPKGELVRLVLSPQGEIARDPTGKAQGRGAYLCPSFTCWEEGLRKRRLGYALRTEVDSQRKEHLLALASSLFAPGRAQDEP